MARRALVVAVFLVMVTLAGCTGGDEEAERADGLQNNEGDRRPEAISREQAAGLMPLWFPGLVFSYSLVHHPTGDEGRIDFVVLDGPGQSFTLDPMDDDEATRDLLGWMLYWDFPLGAVKDTDFEPRLDNTALDWFSFPIEDSDAWQGVAPDGDPLSFSAQLVRVILPEGDEVMAYEVTGTRDGTTMLTYTYTSQVGWFVSFTWDATGDGQPELSLQLNEVKLRRDLVERPLRAPEVFLDVRLDGVGLSPLQGLPDIPELPGLPVELVSFDLGEPDEEAYFVARFAGGPGFYETNVTLGEDDAFSWQWVNDDVEQGEHWSLDRMLPSHAQGEARLIVLADGHAQVRGFQMLPVEV